MDIMEIIKAASMIMAGASILANMTKNETDNKAVNILNTILGFFAGNFNVKGIFNK